MTVRASRPFELSHRPSIFVTSNRRSGPTGRVIRVRRVATIAALICLVAAFVSYVNAISGRSDSSLGIRTVEWLRDNGARGLVDRIENLYYSLTAPTVFSLPLKIGFWAAAVPSEM